MGTRPLAISTAGLLLLASSLAVAQPEPTEGDDPAAADESDAVPETDDSGDRADSPSPPDTSEAARLSDPPVPAAVADDGADAAGPNFAWKPPAGALRVSDRVSLGGYVEGVFAGSSEDWTTPDSTQLGAPGQLLVPNTNKSSFQFDGALILRANPHPRATALLELHLVSDPSGGGAAGPGGLTIALTEAAASWTLVEEVLTLSAGLFWAPFGTVNKDWLGGTGLFVLIPRASGAFPTHYNERGVRINGSKAFDTYFGINYVVSVGNGLDRFNIGGQRSTDLDGSRTINSRIAVFSGLGEELQIGYSAAFGTLRSETSMDTTLEPNDPLRFASEMLAQGVDLIWDIQDFGLRGYYIYSKESLEDTTNAVSPAALVRQGFMFEASYKVQLRNLKMLTAVVPKARFDLIVRDVLGADPTQTADMQSAVYSLGLDVRVGRNLGTVLSLEYHFQDELKGQAELDNNRIVGRLLTTF